MLTFIRRLARSPLIGGFIIALLIAAFALWGVTDVFRGVGNSVAAVGSERVTVQDLNRAFEQQVRQVQIDNPGMTREEADRAGLGDQVLQGLIGQAALDAQAKELGLAISDDRVAETIRSIPAFQGGFSNRFDRASYEQALSQQGWTPGSFEAEIRGELRREQFIEAALAGANPPDVMAQARIAHRGERRAIRALLLPPGLADDPGDPDDAELENFIAEYEQAFRLPEQRRFTLVRVDPAMLAERIEVDENDLQALYESQVSNGEFGEPATRSYAQWTAPDATTARTLAEALNAGADPEQAARDAGLGAPAVRDDLQAYEIPDSDLADVVFALNEDEAAAVEGRSGWRVVHVRSAFDPEIPSFDEAESELRADLARDEAENLLFDILAEFEDARSGGATLEEAAAAAGLPAESFDWVAQNGYSAQRIPLESLLETPEILETAFESPEGFDTDFADYGEGGYFALRVDGVQEPRLPELDEVREEATEFWRAVRIDEALEARLAQARERAEAGETLNAIAEDIGGGARVETATLRRDETAGPFNAQLVAAAFGARVGALFESRAGDQRTHALAQVSQMLPGEGEVDGQTRDELRAELSQDIALALERALIGAYDVQINEELRDVALGRTEPDPTLQQFQ